MALLMGSGRVVPVVLTNIVSNQTKNNITPSSVSQIIRPDDGYTGLGQVTVNAIPDSYYLPSGTYTVINSGTYDIKSKLSVSTPAMVNPTWTAATLNSSQAKITYSITLSSGFKSNNQTFSSSYVLPSVTGTTITPGDTSQTAVAAYRWTLGSVIVEAIPSIISIYKKIYDKTINDSEINIFLSNRTSIASYMFVECNNLTSVYGSAVTSMGVSAFQSCSNLITVSFPNLSRIPDRMCLYCFNLLSVYFNTATAINTYAFRQCSSLTTVSAPNVSVIGDGTFAYCRELHSINLPKLDTIMGGAFSYCYELQSISFSLVSLISGGYTFYSCSELSYVSLPELIKISGYSTFAYCNNSLFTSITLPKCSYISAQTFISCHYLQTISLPKIETFYSQYQFRYCYRLTSLYLMNSVVATLSNSNAFNSTPIGGYSTSSGTFGSIYVPASLLTAYQTATNWSYFSSRFVGI